MRVEISLTVSSQGRPVQSSAPGIFHYSFLGNRSNGNIVEEEKKKRD
jgi:hypothetical protein